MSVFEITTLALVAAWLGVLTVVVLAFVRQLALVQLRLEHGNPFASQDGPEIGSDFPQEASVALRNVNGDGPAYLLFLSPTCGPCVEIASHLSEHNFVRPVLALFGGDDRMASDFETLFPSTVRTIRDPVAGNVAQALGVNVMPLALQVENGVVTGKAHLRAVDDLVRLMDAYAISDAAELARRGGHNGDCP